MKRFACLLLSALVLLSLAGCGGEDTAQLDLFAMDTYMTLTARGETAQEALTAVSREINRLEGLLSRTLPDSDIARLNADGAARLDETTAALLQRALELSERTGGAFDVRATHTQPSAGQDVLQEQAA